MATQAKQLVTLAARPGTLWRNVAFRMPHQASRRRHIFILGVPRSGTTLLKTILAAHPLIGGSDYESTGIFGLRDIFQYAMGELTPAQIQHLLQASEDVIVFYDKIADRLLERTGKQVFVDKLQMRRYRLWYVQKYFPEAVFVHIIRDGRDGYCSALHHPNVLQARGLERWARYWSDSVLLPDRVIAPHRLYHLRYEDLTANAEETIAGLMTFLGLPYSSAQVDVQHFSAVTSIKKRKVHENLARPINTRSQGRWRNELEAQDRKRFWQIAGATLERFGYERE